MTNEKMNPMPYRAADAAAMFAAAGAAEAAGPDMAAPMITPDDVARGTELLRRYKDGKRALEARIIADEQWYRLRHWQYLRDRRREQGADVVEPTSAWLFNAIVSKHADAMDSFPEAVILPRSEQDEPDAKALSAIVPAVLEKTHFEQVWSDAWWYKLKHGCAAYGVFWDSAGSNGLGDVAVRQLDLLNLFWEPGITDIQASRNLFVCALMDNDDISAAWPDARPGSCGVELAQYLYDDAVDTSNKSIVVDWYYKKPLPGGGTALHLIKFTGRDLLYASENDPAMAGGFYPHGQYPVVFDVLYPEAGTPCGFGMIAVSKDPQQYIDRLSGNLLEMSMKASTPRFWVKKGCGVNAQEFLDWSKPLVEVEGSIDDERLRQISLYNLDGQWVNMLQLKIDELKETSNSRDVTQGSVSGGVTAASAIAALQEAGSKSSRDTLRASYRAFERVVELVIELIRAYYTETRPFRVAAQGAQGYAFCTYSNAGLQARTVGMDADGMALQRAPAFDGPAQRADGHGFLSGLVRRGRFRCGGRSALLRRGGKIGFAHILCSLLPSAGAFCDDAVFLRLRFQQRVGVRIRARVRCLRLRRHDAAAHGLEHLVAPRKLHHLQHRHRLLRERGVKDPQLIQLPRQLVLRRGRIRALLLRVDRHVERRRALQRHAVGVHADGP